MESKNNNKAPAMKSLAHRKCSGIAAFGLVLTVAFIVSETSIFLRNFSRNHDGDATADHKSILDAEGRNIVADSLETSPSRLGGRYLFSLSNFDDPATIEQKGSGQQSFADPNSPEAQRSRCQIIYILGVEVSIFWHVEMLFVLNL
jgi:hypothetical protein